MAKKIRFPLIMDNGQEVKSIEELRDNFSADKVIEYLKNGQLVTWLNDRYLTEISEQVIVIDPNDKNAENELRKAFGMKYDEAEEEVTEELVIRSRKMGKLKDYTNEKKYFDVIDNMAFDQDELYDLLDEDKRLIYLCGDKFSIPLSVKNTKYIGVNNPVAVIDSKEKVDFNSRNISFENIRFDEKYCEIIGAPNICEYDDEDYLSEEECAIDEAQPDDEYDCSLIEFASDLRRFVNEFNSEDLDFDFQELCDDYDEVEEPDCDDYGNEEYDYSMRSEVQSACKEALESVTEDLRTSFEDIVDDLKSDSLEKLEDIPGLFHNFIDDFTDAYYEYADDYDFDAKTQVYIKSYFENKFSISILNSKIQSYRFEEKAEKIFDTAFGDKNIGLDKSKKYRDLCDYDKDDDTFCYDISDAVETMTEDVNSYLDSAVCEFREKVEDCCKSIQSEFVEYLLSSIDSI